MSEELDEGSARVGGPEGYGAVLVADVQDCVLRVLGQGGGRALFCGGLDDELAGRGVGVF